MKLHVILSLAASPLILLAVPSSAATRNYDCTKAGNANKAACKTAAAQAAAPAKPVHPRTMATPVTAAGPQGATAKCRDNTYSHSKDHKGACSHHGGVANWY